MKSLGNRLIGGTATACAMAMALAGCGGSGNNASNGEAKASDEPVTLTISWWGSDARLKLTQQAIDAFHAKHPNITVNVEYSDWTGYWDKLATQNAGGEVPDVLQMDEMYLASYASQGSLYDLSKVSNYLDLNQMDASLKGTGEYQGTQYAAPISSAAYAIIVNNDVLDKYGVTLPDTSKWTWDDLVKVGEQIVQKSGGEATGIGTMIDSTGLTQWARQHGESLFKDGKVSISEGTLAEFLQMSYDWTHGSSPIAGSSDRWAEQMAGTQDQSDFAQGKQAMVFAQAAMITSNAKSAGTDNMSLVPIPSSDQSKKSAYLKPSQYWSISAKSEHPAEAAMLIDYLINDEEAGKILGTERGIPGNNKIRAALAKSTTGTDQKALEFQDVIEDKLGDAPEITPNGGSDVMNVIKRYEQNVAFGDKTAAQAAKEMIAELQASIDAA
ncbi:ABC transporter substrate-binding protein [Bifidobacterium avesanii]|uniref:Extracellular solute-binding protein n=1 Tax=Bifidobacterium avesanii TaxID=1798157 RepID=A0A7K3TIS7_9BIFI|nr:sugar ABC transporter substrate-binding protein [Bifidobacterium avesanii]KAB8290333.1 ABC transporter substrate-binding protein [Bifidobacterium avesanii]NEG78992.1 extracellular solute-binding protein [Bifidobacterium avesanii]